MSAPSLHALESRVNFTEQVAEPPDQVAVILTEPSSTEPSSLENVAKKLPPTSNQLLTSLYLNLRGELIVQLTGSVTAPPQLRPNEACKSGIPCMQSFTTIVTGHSFPPILMQAARAVPGSTTMDRARSIIAIVNFKHRSKYELAQSERMRSNLRLRFENPKSIPRNDSATFRIKEFFRGPSNTITTSTV